MTPKSTERPLERRKPRAYEDRQRRRENNARATAKFHQHNKEKVRKMQHFLYLARVAHPIRQKCSHAECSLLGQRHHPDYRRPKNIIWLCQRHHDDVHQGKARLCKIKKCGNLHLAKGYCNKHWKQFGRLELCKRNQHEN